MKTKTILRILNICGWIFLFKPCAWILWKVEILLTEMPALILFGIVGGLIGLNFLTKSGTENIPLWFYILLLYFCFSILWSIIRTIAIERIECQDKKS